VHRIGSQTRRVVGVRIPFRKMRARKKHVDTVLKGVV
jgi:hypothetical protein